MRLPHKPLSTLCNVVSAFFLSLSVLAYLLFPTRSIRNLLSQYYIPVEKHFNLLLVVLLIGAGITHLLAYFIARLARKEAGPRRPPKPMRQEWGRSVLFFQILMTTIIVVRIGLQLPAPLQWEDNCHFSDDIQDPLYHFNPVIKTENHAIASLCAYYSVQLFGMSKFSIRLPAVLASLAFLFILNMLCWRFFPPLSAVFVFSNLACNQMALWFMTSVRGYIFAMLWTVCGIYLTFQMLFGKTRRLSFYPWLYIILAYLSAATHLFASLANGLIFLSMILWIRLSDRPLSQKRKKVLATWTLLYVFLVLPIYAYVFYHQALWLERLGDFFKGGIPDLRANLMRVVGASFDWYGKFMLLFLFALAALRLRQKKKESIHLITTFILACVFFFTVVFWALEVRLVESRFLLPFLTPFLLWLGLWVSGLEHKRIKQLCALSVLILYAVIPLKSTRAIYNFLTLNVADFDRFVALVKEKTAPVSENCYSYSGEPNMIYFTRTLYLGPYQGVKEENSGCKNHFHLYFESTPELPPIDTRPTEENAHYRKILDYHDKMKLFVRLSENQVVQSESNLR